ncbi:MAG: PAS domain-containing protein [Halioglobus sp.]|nr:PAS domain-containing protein [Halioglobus sp.]
MNCYALQQRTRERTPPFGGRSSSRRKDGELRDIELVITPFTDDISDVTHFVSIQRDITANKRVQAELQRGKERLHALLNTAQDAVITIDRQGVVQDCNAAVERLFGLAEGRGIARPQYRRAHAGAPSQPARCVPAATQGNG